MWFNVYTDPTHNSLVLWLSLNKLLYRTVARERGGRGGRGGRERGEREGGREGGGEGEREGREGNAIKKQRQLLKVHVVSYCKVTNCSKLDETTCTCTI